MDEGLAAMIAGAAGAGGAALAAYATGIGLLRQAKLQGDQAHRLWLRNQQNQACVELLDRIQEVESQCNHIALLSGFDADADRTPEEVQEENREAFSRSVELMFMQKSMTNAFYRATPFLDPEVVPRAAEFVGKVQLLCEKARDLATENSRTGTAPPSTEYANAERAVEGAKVGFLAGMHVMVGSSSEA
ncbi:hypothetical protein ACFQ6C_07600 [Streptomyces sp. NPDC056454]|uniref:hypothetical protein n=1 Tax=Streptomyces sp. NPDC056454 TaxID=3345823 RepID=UPI0036CE4A44